MNIQQVQYLLTVYRVGSISRAAGELYLAQSYLSNTIRAVEDELGFPIFTRSNRGIVPTERGLRVLEQAGIMWECYQSMRRMADDSPAPQFRLGIDTYTPMVDAYVSLCTAYQDEPQLDFTCQFLSTEQIADRLYLSMLDLGVSMATPAEQEKVNRLVSNRRLELHPLKTIPIVLRIGSHHPLYRNPEIRLSDFNQYAFVDYDGSTLLELSQQNAFSNLQPKLGRCVTAPDRDSKSRLVAESTMYTVGCLLPAKINHRYAFRNIPLGDANYQVFYITREGQALSPEASQYLKLLKKFLDDLQL